MGSASSSPVVQVVAEAGNHQGQTLDLPQLLPPGGVGDDREHQLTDVEGMTPVVVGHTAVISPDRAQPSRNKVEFNLCMNHG